MNPDTLRNIRKMLRLHMNGEVSAAMKARGIDYKINFGLDSISIREVARRFKPDSLLAEELWKESSREGKILATLLYPKAEFTSDKADEWIAGCFTTELAEQLCFNLLQHLSTAPETAMKWILCDDLDKKSYGYLLLLRLILVKKELPEISQALILAENDQLSTHFQLRQQASRLLGQCLI